MSDVRRIVVATDGSHAGSAAVEVGVQLAKETNAVTTFVHVRRAPLPILGCPDYERALSSESKVAQQVVDAAADLAAAAGVESESEILQGDPAEQIVDLARLRDADMIVVGARALGGLGSVSDAVVNHADRSVLVVRPSAVNRRAA
jgi:nucleotide-binding universal stress UspA family protein